MKISLKNICIAGFIGTSLVVLKNLFAFIFEQELQALTFADTSTTSGFVIEYGLIGFYYLTLLIYLFKKQYIVASIIWIFQVIIYVWYLYFMNNFDLYDGNIMQNIAKLNAMIKIAALMTSITGVVFIASRTRARIWLFVFGISMILSAIPMFFYNLIIEFRTAYSLFMVLIPVSFVINYWLEIKNTKAPNNWNNAESEIIDGDL
jgi:hypothetical protein